MGAPPVQEVCLTATTLRHGSSWSFWFSTSRTLVPDSGVAVGILAGHWGGSCQSCVRSILCLLEGQERQRLGRSLRLGLMLHQPPDRPPRASPASAAKLVECEGEGPPRKGLCVVESRWPATRQALDWNSRHAMSTPHTLSHPPRPRAPRPADDRRRSSTIAVPPHLEQGPVLDPHPVLGLVGRHELRPVDPLPAGPLAPEPPVHAVGLDAEVAVDPDRNQPDFGTADVLEGAPEPDEDWPV